MELTQKNFKTGTFNINIKDQRLDDACYIMMVLIHRFNILNFIKNQENLKTNYRSNAVSEKDGVLIGSLENAYGEFEFYINGYPRMTLPDGASVETLNVYEKILLDNKKHELHFDSTSYIIAKNLKAPQKYYGVFYTLGDAIKTVSENEFVKVGEVTS